MTSGEALAPLYAVGTAPPRPGPIPLTEALERSRADREDRQFEQGSLALEEARWADDRYFGPQPTRANVLPDPRPIAGQLGVALAEVLAGLRSPTQLVRWTTPEVQTVISQRAATVARRLNSPESRRTPRPRLRLLRVHVCQPSDGIAEAAVVIHDGRRTRAIAIRLAGIDGRWRVEVLQIG